MIRRNRLLMFIPILVAIFVALGLTVLRPAHASDFSLGVSTGVLLGLSIASIAALKQTRC